MEHKHHSLSLARLGETFGETGLAKKSRREPFLMKISCLSLGISTKP